MYIKFNNTHFIVVRLIGSSNSVFVVCSCGAQLAVSCVSTPLLGVQLCKQPIRLFRFHDGHAHHDLDS